MKLKTSYWRAGSLLFLSLTDNKVRLRLRA